MRPAFCRIAKLAGYASAPACAVVLLLAACGANESQLYSTKSLEEAQTETPFRLLVPDFTVLHEAIPDEELGPMVFRGTRRKFQTPDTIIVFIRYDLPRFNDASVFQTNSRTSLDLLFQNIPSSSTLDISGLNVIHAILDHPSRPSQTFDFVCGGIPVGVRLVQDLVLTPTWEIPLFDVGKRIVESMLPDECPPTPRGPNPA